MQATLTPPRPPEQLMHQITVPQGTLGFGAVRAVISAQTHNATRPNELHRAYDEVDGLRSQFASLGPRERALVDPYLGELATQVFGGAHSRPARPKNQRQPWADWLARRATDAEIADFASAHIDELERINNSQAEQAELNKHRQRYILSLLEGARDGGLSSHVYEVARELRDTRILYGDIWDTFMRGRAGYHTRRTDHVVIQQNARPGAHIDPDFWSPPKSLVVAHELGHVRFGTWLPDWANEAIDHYVVIQQQHGRRLSPGDMESFMPQVGRSVAERAYPSGRYLMHVALKGLDPSLATRMWSSEGPHSTESQQFEAALDEAWGIRGSWHRINARQAYHQARIWKEYKGRLNQGELLGRASQAVAEELEQNPGAVFPELRKHKPHRNVRSHRRRWGR